MSAAGQSMNLRRFTVRVQPGERVSDALYRSWDDRFVRALSTSDAVTLRDLLAFAESRCAEAEG